MKHLMKFSSEKTKMNGDSGLALNMDAGIVVSSDYFQNYQLKKSKRFRSAFTTEQIHYLESEFKKFPYIGSANRKEVANILKISERAVKIWFQNRRMKEKREVNSNKEMVVEDKNNICNAFSNDQLNNRNLHSHNDSSTNELLLSSRCQNEHLKEPNKETRKPNYNPNEAISKAKQIKVKSVSNINISENQLDNIPMDMTKGTRKLKIFKSTLISKTMDDTRNVQAATQRSRPIQKLYHTTRNNNQNNMKEFKSQEKNPILVKQENLVAQDLSISNVLIDQKEHQQFYPVHSNTDQRLLPVLSQGYYVPQSIAANQPIHSGNVIWKPVSLMPVLPELASSMSIGHNTSISLSNQDILKGTCNCHGPPHVFNTRMQSIARTQPQYILAIPFSNSSSNS